MKFNEIVLGIFYDVIQWNAFIQNYTIVKKKKTYPT